MLSLTEEAPATSTIVIDTYNTIHCSTRTYTNVRGYVESGASSSGPRGEWEIEGIFCVVGGCREAKKVWEVANSEFKAHRLVCVFEGRGRAQTVAALPCFGEGGEIVCCLFGRHFCRFYLWFRRAIAISKRAREREREILLLVPVDWQWQGRRPLWEVQPLGWSSERLSPARHPRRLAPKPAPIWTQPGAVPNRHLL